jgi:hypothetical protein
MNMDGHNEYGNCWEDLLKRNDMENRRADAEMERWARQDEENPHLARQVDGYGPEWMRRGWEEEREKEISNKRGILRENNRKNARRRGPEKEKTGEEMRKLIVEKAEVRAVKRAKTEAKRMVKKGSIVTIDRYFK